MGEVLDLLIIFGGTIIILVIIILLGFIIKKLLKKLQLKKDEKVKLKMAQYNVIAIEKRLEMVRLEKEKKEKKRKKRSEYERIKERNEYVISPKPDLSPLWLTCPNCLEQRTKWNECDLCGWVKPKPKEKNVEEEKKKSRRISQRVKNEVWRRDNGKCADCGSRINLEYGHIIPFSKGGSNTARNIELLCEKCNRKKYNKI